MRGQGPHPRHPHPHGNDVNSRAQLYCRASSQNSRASAGFSHERVARSQDRPAATTRHSSSERDHRPTQSTACVVTHPLELPERWIRRAHPAGLTISARNWEEYVPIPIGLGAGATTTRPSATAGTMACDRVRVHRSERRMEEREAVRCPEGEETELDRRPKLSTIRVVAHPSKFPRKMQW